MHIASFYVIASFIVIVYFSSAFVTSFPVVVLVLLVWPLAVFFSSC